MSISKKPIVAAFDFDKTLIDRDSLLPFLFYTTGTLRTLGKLFLETPFLLGYLMGVVPRQKTKERVLTRFFSGKSLDEINKLGEAYGKGSLNRYIKKKALDRLAWHKAQGHRCIIISASIETYLIPWAKEHGVQEVLSSRLEDNNGIVTGKLIGKNCWGPEKVRRLSDLLGDKEGYTLYAYGDSRGDKELLELADYPFFNSL